MVHNLRAQVYRSRELNWGPQTSAPCACTDVSPSTPSVQYKELKLGSHSGHAKTNLSGHCVKMSGHYFLKVTPILKYMI